MRKSKLFKCIHCEVVFSSSNNDAKFCGRRCSAIYNNKKRGNLSEKTKDKIRRGLKKYNVDNPKPKNVIKIKCGNCEKEFIADKKNRKYCSNKCRYKARSHRQKGQLSTRTFQKILKRAFPDWKCPFCDWNKTFDTHHVKARKDKGDENTGNLVMLCPNHHSEAHLKDDNPLKTIKNGDLKEYTIGKHYTGDELMDNFYYGNIAKKFAKNN